MSQTHSVNWKTNVWVKFSTCKIRTFKVRRSDEDKRIIVRRKKFSCDLESATFRVLLELCQTGQANIFFNIRNILATTTWTKTYFWKDKEIWKPCVEDNKIRYDSF